METTLQFEQLDMTLTLLEIDVFIWNKSIYKEFITCLIDLESRTKIW